MKIKHMNILFKLHVLDTCMKLKLQINYYESLVLNYFNIVVLKFIMLYNELYFHIAGGWCWSKWAKSQFSIFYGIQFSPKQYGTYQTYLPKCDQRS